MHVCIVSSHPATFLNEPTIPEEQAVELHIRTSWVAHRAMGPSDAALLSASPVKPVPVKPVPRANTL